MYSPYAETQRRLKAFVAEHHGVAGNVHVDRGGDLSLTAAKNLSPPEIVAVTDVPHDNGMAGAAQTTMKPAQTCNLQVDGTGCIMQNAKAAPARAAIALPLPVGRGGVTMVVGFTYDKEGEIPPVRMQALMSAAATVPRPE